ncbi:hypothetical protein CROQUDRAFT_94725 [Cronartium quercuum f. sp. fusiforme G11]|uniref:Uncharacterized protein n=1 Tax=Cronartium quercuum f. sp. fusiforme G11 TaxID=708437 RepID=A0A9P6NIB2_9BASI|nr:hypothetical protein CROQUDRAFT_94725 [Cronartium quercuum f. sp. fusiforme G11]
MPSTSSSPLTSPIGIRARLSSALKSKSRAKDLGISYATFAQAKKATSIDDESTSTLQTDAFDSLLDSLDRSSRISGKYTLQRSTKIPLRVPGEFPRSQNFSQRLLYAFEDFESDSDSEKDNDSLIDPFRTSSTTNLIRPQIEKIEFPPPLLGVVPNQLNSFQPSTPSNNTFPISRQPVQSAIPFVSSTQVTPGLKICSPSTNINCTPSHNSVTSSHLTTPALTLSTSTTHSMKGPGSIYTYSSCVSSSRSPPSPTPSSSRSSSPPTNAEPIDDLAIKTSSQPLSKKIDISISTCVLQSPVDVPFPITTRRGPGPEILAGLDFLQKLCARLDTDDCENMKDEVNLPTISL